MSFISQAKFVLAWFSMKQCVTWGLWESFSTVFYMVGGILFRITRTRSFQFTIDYCFPHRSQWRQWWTALLGHNFEQRLKTWNSAHMCNTHMCNFVGGKEGTLALERNLLITASTLGFSWFIHEAPRNHRLERIRTETSDSHGFSVKVFLSSWAK